MTRRATGSGRATSRFRRLTAATALALAATGLPVLVGTATAQPSLTEVTNEDLFWSYDEGAGCSVPGVWMLCVYFQQGLDSVARVVPDDHRAANANGSLRLSTPGSDDEVLLEHQPEPGAAVATRFASLDHGEVRLDVLSGAGPRLRVGVSGCEDAGLSHLLLSYAGPLPAAGSGWRTIDLVDGGSALWTEQRLGTHPLSFFQSLCPDGMSMFSSIGQAGPDRETRLDGLTLGDWGVDFVVPPLTREAAPRRANPNGDGAQGQRMARQLATRQFQDGSWSDDWTDPTRLRVPLARAAVIGFQDSPMVMLAAAALADRVNGVLLTNPTGKLRFDTWGALVNQVGRHRPVYLVGSTRQLTAGLVNDLKEQGWGDVRRVGGASNAATAVAVARVVDRRRPSGRRAQVVVVDSSQAAQSLSAPVLAGRRQAAIVLSSQGRLPRATRRYLAAHPRTLVSTVGPAASRAVPRARHFVGRTPEATAVKVARTIGSPRAVTFAATAQGLEAVLAARHAARWDRPLLLVKRDRVPGAVRLHLESLDGLDQESLVVGGTGSVDEATLARLRALVVAAG